jgi:glycosyltransferase involved in cell wall biosynthesis
MKLSNLAIITLYPPSETKETFLLDEIAELGRRTRLQTYPLKKQVDGNGLNSFWTLTWLNFLFLAFRPLEFLKAICFLILKSKGRCFFRNLLYLGQINKIYSDLASKQIDHIHAYWASSPAFAAQLISKWLNISFSFTAHRYDILENDFLEYKIHKAKFVRSISDWGQAELFKSCSKTDERKIKTIYLSIKVPPFKKTDEIYNKLKIAVIGNYNSRKGHRYLIKALKNIDKKYIATFYGKGPLKSSLQKLVSRGKLSKKIKIEEFLPHNILLDKLKTHQFNLIVLPSLSEGLPAALIEGAAHSILIIGSDRGGTAELIGKESNFLISDPTNPERIRRTLEAVNKDSARQAIKQSYKTIKDKFDVKVCAKKLVDEITGG